MADVTIPEPWASALIKAGMTDPRYADRDIPSLSRLSEATGFHTSTLSAMVTGRKRTRPEVIEGVAEALRRDIVEVSGWVQRARTVREPWRPPAAVNSLTTRQQRAITELILSMAEPRGELVDHESAPIVTSGPEFVETPGEAPSAPPGGAVRARDRKGRASRPAPAPAPSRGEQRTDTNHGGT